MIAETISACHVVTFKQGVRRPAPDAALITGGAFPQRLDRADHNGADLARLEG